MRIIAKCFLKYSKHVRSLNKVHFRYLARAITGDRVTNLNEETLTGRMLLYLNNDKQQNTKKMWKNNDLLEVLKENNLTALQDYDTDHLMNAFNLLTNRKYVRDKNTFLNMLQLLDDECCSRLNLLDNDTIFKLLQCYMTVIPNRIVEMKFYNHAVDKLTGEVEKLSKNDLLQLIFYVGLLKKSHISQVRVRKSLKCLTKDFIDDLTTEELCIICNSTFKTSTKISNRYLLNKVRNYINDNLAILKDPAMFITLIKTLRHNRYQNDDLLESISCTIFFNKTFDCYTMPAICHILALYSDYLYYDQNVYKMFVDKCVEELKTCNLATNKHAYLVEQPRGKDLKRFLWVLSNINYKDLAEDDIKNVIVPKVMELIESREFANDPGALFEIILYLWMLKYRARELVPYAFTKENLRVVLGKNSPSKERLNLLLACMYFEDRNYFKAMNVQPIGRNDYNMKVQLQKRPMLQRILENLKPVAAEHNISHFELSCAVPYLNIVGITGYQNKIYKSVHIEVLDEYTCVKNTTNKLPSGLMQLKLRILDGFEEGLIVIDSDDVECMTESRLYEFFMEEINFVC